MFIRGPETRKLLAWEPSTSSGQPELFLYAVYEEGNVVENLTTVRGDPQAVYAATRFAPYSMRSEQSPQEAGATIVQDVGANRPVRDAADQRVINNLVSRTGRLVSGVRYGLTWPTLAGGAAPIDDDRDGMPDDWEKLHFGTTARGSPTDSSSDFDGDGYTDLEEYLNGTDPKVPDSVKHAAARFRTSDEQSRKVQTAGESACSRSRLPAAGIAFICDRRTDPDPLRGGRQHETRKPSKL